MPQTNLFASYLESPRLNRPAAPRLSVSSSIRSYLAQNNGTRTTTPYQPAPALPRRASPSRVRTLPDLPRFAALPPVGPCHACRTSPHLDGPGPPSLDRPCQNPPSLACRTSTHRDVSRGTATIRPRQARPNLAWSRQWCKHPACLVALRRTASTSSGLLLPDLAMLTLPAGPNLVLTHRNRHPRTHTSMPRLAPPARP